MLPPGTFCARDIIFCPDYYETKSQELFDEIIVPTYCFNEMIEQFEDGEVLYITLYNMRNGKSYMVTLGSPHNDDPSVIFVPQWILDAMEYTEGPVRMDVMDRMEVMDIPAARKIVIAPQDSYAFDIDLRECIERTIVNLHSIQEGCLLPFVDGDVVMVARIQKVEPMTISRIVMGEVEVEFVNLFAKDMHDSSSCVSSSCCVSSSHINETVNVAVDPHMEQEDAIHPPAVPRGRSLSIAQAWDYYQGEERTKMIRDARMKRFNGSL